MEAKVAKLVQLFEDEWDYQNLFRKGSKFYNYQVYKAPKGMHKIEIIKEVFRKSGYSKKLYNNCFKMIGKSVEDLTKSAEYKSHLVFGSPDSRDVDVVYFVESWEEAISYDRDLLVSKLPEYDLTKRDLDVTIVKVDQNGNVEKTSKGSCYQTQNIIFYTSGYHKHNHNLVNPITQGISFEKLNPLDNCRAVIKFILDNLTKLVDPKNYAKLRDEKIFAYGGGLESRSAFIREKVMNILILDADCYKSIVMKLSQILLLEKGILEYNKCLLGDKVEKYFPELDSNEINWYLSRGERGSKQKDFPTFHKMIDHLFRIIENNLIRLEDWKVQSINKLQETEFEIDDQLVKLFHKFPNGDSDLIINRLTELYKSKGDSNAKDIGSLFVIPTKNLDHLPAFLEPRVHSEPQRSPEWKKLLNFYRCGRNTGIKQIDPHLQPQERIRFYWNLIRGCMGEVFAQKFYSDFPDYTRVEVGLIVDEKGLRNSPGYAPDLLLIKGDDVIPVEIKCMIGPFCDNGKRRRAINLAVGQVRTLGKSIGSKLGVILLIYVESENFRIYSHTIKI